MVIYTIGFSKKNLREFMSRLQKAGINKVIDIRLNNTSQLAGYAKKDDLAYVLELVGIEYEHVPELAPTDEILTGYKNKQMTWDEYEKVFGDLLKQRNAVQYREKVLSAQAVCLLCAEDKPARCHRRLVAEYFAALSPGTEVKHL